MKILVINGPNLNMLGVREPEIYGKQSYEELVLHIERYAKERGVAVECVQSNHEGDLVDAIQNAYGVFQGIIINPAAYTHTSIALEDAVKAVGIPAVEVHLSAVESREAYRQVSYIRNACIKTITGKGFAGYTEAVEILLGTEQANKAGL